MTLQSRMDQAVRAHQAGRLAAAEPLYREILQADPGHVQAQHMLGVLRGQQGRPDEALALIGAALRHHPGDPVARTNYALVLLSLGRAGEALVHLDAAVAAAPAYIPALYQRANALWHLERLDEALAAYGRALAAAPDFADARIGQANTLRRLGRLAESLAAYDAVLAREPENFDALLMRANLLNQMAHHTAARDGYARALALRPDHAEAHNGRGWAILNLEGPDAALPDFRDATRLAPDHAFAWMGQSLCHLMQQDFEAGLPLYEWRKRLPEPMGHRDLPQPAWTGAEDLAGKTLFVHAEQGLGDVIQFSRYLRLAAERGARVIFAAPEPLHRLLAPALAPVALIGFADVPPTFDYHIALLSLPLAFATRADTIPAPLALAAEPALAERWHARLGDGGFRIGVAWGAKASTVVEDKAFRAAALAAIAARDGVRLINLQKDAVAPGLKLESWADADQGPDAFVDTAAIIARCDLVITADNAIAHLAGSLGAPCWLALKHVPDWRWFLGRDDSPWYPSLRLFRQPAPGDWDSVFAAMASVLDAARGDRAPRP